MIPQLSISLTVDGEPMFSGMVPGLEGSGKPMASLVLVAIAASAVLADGEPYGYVSSEGTVPVTNVPTDPRFEEIIPKPRYHAAVSAQKLEEAVNRYARKYRLSLRSCSP